MRIVGYVVTCTYSTKSSTPKLMELSTNRADGNLELYFGDNATMFDTYDEARNAIRRTVRSYNSNTMPDGGRWDWHKEFGKPRIVRLTKPE